MASNAEYVFRTRFDGEGVRQMQQAFDALPARLRQVANNLVNIDRAALGGKGEQIADALHRGLQQRLRGNQVNLADFVRTEVPGLDRLGANWQRVARQINSSFGEIGRSGGLTEMERSIARTNQQLQRLAALRDAVEARGSGRVTVGSGDQRRWATRDLANLAEQAGVAAPGRGQGRQAVLAQLEQQANRLAGDMGRVAPYFRELGVTLQRAGASGGGGGGQQPPRTGGGGTGGGNQEPRRQNAFVNGLTEREVNALRERSSDRAAGARIWREMYRSSDVETPRMLGAVSSGRESGRSAAAMDAFSRSASRAAQAAESLARAQESQRFGATGGVTAGRRAFREAMVAGGGAVPSSSMMGQRMPAGQTPEFQTGFRAGWRREAEAAARAEERLAAARRRQTQESEAAARAAARGQSLPQWLQDFQRGFRGNPDRGVGEQFGQTARLSMQYGLMYRALSALTNVVGQVTQDFLSLEDNVAGLAMVLGKTTDDAAVQDLADSFGKAAVDYGFASSTGVAAGTQAIGYYGISSEDSAYQRYIAQGAAEAAMRMSRTSGITDDAGMRLLQRQVVGVQRSFGVPDSQIKRVEDALTVISKQSGTTVAETSAAIADIGTLAAQAGFTLEETGAFLSRIQTTTGGTPLAASGAMRQVLSKADDPVIQEQLRTVGVDTVGTTLKDQLDQLSSMGGLSPQQERMLIQKFGRNSSDQGLSILLRDWEQIKQTAESASPENAAGAGEESFAKLMESAKQQLQMFGQRLVELGVQLARSGILAPLGTLMKLIETLAVTLTSAVRLFNELPAPLRNGAAHAVALGVALHALNLMMSTQLVQSVVALTARFGLMNAAMGSMAAFGGRAAAFRGARAGGASVLSALGSMFGMQGLAAARAGRAAAGAGGATQAGMRAAVEASTATVGRGPDATRAARLGVGAASGAAGLAGMVSSMLPIIIPLVATAAFAFWMNSKAKEDLAASEQGGAALAQLGARDARSAEEFQAARDEAKALKAQAAGNQGETSWLLKTQGWQARLADTFVPGTPFEDRTKLAARVSRAAALYDEGAAGRAGRLLHGNRYADVDQDRAAAASFEAAYDAHAEYLKEIEEETARRLKLDPALGIDFSSADTLQNSLKTLTDQGYSAAESIDLVNKRWADMTGEMQLSGQYDTRVRPGEEKELAGAMGGAVLNAMAERAGTLQKEAAGEGANAQASARELAKLNQLPDDWSQQFTQRMEQHALQMGEQAGPGGMWTPEMRAQFESQALAEMSALGLEAGVSLNRHTIKAFSDAAMGTMSQYASQGLNPAQFAAANQVFPQLAAQKGAEASLMAGGDPLLEQSKRMEVLQQQYQSMSGAVAAARDRLAEMPDTPEKEAEVANLGEAERHLRNFELRIKEAEQDLINVRKEVLANDAMLAASRLREDNVLGRSDINLGMLRSQLGLTTNVEERKRLQAQINDAERQRERDVLDRDIARDRLSVGPRDRGGMLRADLAEARARSQLLTEGSAEWYRNARTIREVEDSLAEYALSVAEASRRVGRDRRDTVGATRDELAAARARLDFARSGGDQLGALEAQNAIADLEYRLRQEQGAIVTARDRAAVMPGDDIGSAASAIRVAQHNVREALRGTVEWFEAQAELRQAQAEYGRVMRQYAANQRMLSVDMTDPVATARVELDAARANRAAAASPWEATNAELEVRRNESALEAAAFRQRIGDLQMNEQLGRITHSTYMSYLSAEHQRLSSIANRTRQQQDQLNEVEQLMQAAADEMSGQFNIGDIKLPTVYQVRRAVGAQIAAERAWSPQAFRNEYNSQITLNGVDFQQVVDYLNTALGGRVGTVTRRGY